MAPISVEQSTAEFTALTPSSQTLGFAIRLQQSGYHTKKHVGSFEVILESTNEKCRGCRDGREVGMEGRGKVGGRKQGSEGAISFALSS